MNTLDMDPARERELSLSAEPVLVLDEITKYYQPRDGVMRLLGKKSPAIEALGGVSLSIPEGSVTAIVGESGSGKTTLGKVICGLERPTSGTVRYRGRDLLTSLSQSRLEITRQIQMVFQDPYESLDPRFTVEMTVSEPLAAHGGKDKSENQRKVNEALLSVGLSPVDRYLRKKPHELSGGERQRVSIARAIVLKPSLILADEPVSMLDVSVRAGVLNLLMRLKDELQASIILITHDLAVARYLAERLIIFYSGGIMEIGETESVLSNPFHPYTSLLLSASPRVKPGRARQRVKGNSFRAGEESCPFVSRCGSAREQCQREKPRLKKAAEGRMCACHFAPSL